MCFKINEYDGIENHHLKCKKCGKFMLYKGTLKTNDCECDKYECECGTIANVSNMDSEHEVFWYIDN